MNEIENRIQMTDDIATSGQPTATQFALIARAGYDVVINLAMPDSDNAVPDEGSIVASHGMSYVHLPVPFDQPRSEHLRSFCRLMNAFSGKRIWVHCVVNYRVSAFMYLYLRRYKDYPEEQARSPMFDRWQPNETWRLFLEQEHAL